MRRLERLRRADDYHRVCRQGYRAVGRAGVAYVMPSPRGVTRVGVQVSRRLGPAVRRNRARRRVREALRRLAERLTAGVDVVIVPRPAALSMGFAALQQDLGDTLAALGVLAQESRGDLR
ncbi:MAG: ribonuclease P protein component [Armatimonadota bacterium]|nr:ribonuclease P protein component [Armatimonadota bacterium]